MAPTKENPYKVFLESKLGKLYVKQHIADVDAAIANAKRLQGSGAAKGGSGKALSSWKKDTALLKSLRAELVGEMKIIQNGKAKSILGIEEAYGDCLETLEWVEHRNHAYQMINDAAVDVKIAAMLPLLGMMTADGAQAIVMKRKLEQIIKDLQAAEKTSKSKTGKAALTSVLIISAALLPPLGVAGTLFTITASLVAADMGGKAIDYAVGEQSSPPDALKTTFSAADASIASAAQVSKSADALSKKVAALAVVWDTADAGFAVYKQKNLEKRLKDFAKEAKASALKMQKKAKAVQRMQKEALAALNQAKSNASSFSSSKSARQRVQKGFKEYHNLN